MREPRPVPVAGIGEVVFWGGEFSDTGATTGSRSRGRRRRGRETMCLAFGCLITCMHMRLCVVIHTSSHYTACIYAAFPSGVPPVFA